MAGLIARLRWRALERDAAALLPAVQTERLRLATMHRRRLLALARELGALS